MVFEFPKYIPRKIEKAVLEASQWYNVIVVTGPRQSGKSTMCRNLFPDYEYYNLEDLALKARVSEDPKGFLNSAAPSIIIDEVQNVPELMSYIQVIVDSSPNHKFVITGSSNFALMRSVTQSLAGRAAVFTLLPLSFAELGPYVEESATSTLLYNGFYPAIFSKGIPPHIFYANYNATYVERDVRQLLELRNQDRFATFMRLCALRIGTEMNMADLAKHAGVSAPTVADWISILKASYILFTLHPYHANLQKRLTKTPKIYFYDTGLASYLMGLTSPEVVDLPIIKGALFENAVVVEMIKKYYNEGKDPHLYFYRENSGKEVDIVEDCGISVNLFEVKASATFKKEFTSNLRYLEKLLGDRVKQTTVVYDGEPIPPSVLNLRQV